MFDKLTFNCSCARKKFPPGEAIVGVGAGKAYNCGWAKLRCVGINKAIPFFCPLRHVYRDGKYCGDIGCYKK